MPLKINSYMLGPAEVGDILLVKTNSKGAQGCSADCVFLPVVRIISTISKERKKEKKKEERKRPARSEMCVYWTEDLDNPAN